MTSLFSVCVVTHGLLAPLLLLLLLLLGTDPCHGRIFLQVYDNTAFGGTPVTEQSIDDWNDGIINYPSVRPWHSLRLQAMLTPPSTSIVTNSSSSSFSLSDNEWWNFQVVADQGYMRLWVDYHLMVDGWMNSTDASADKKPVAVDAKYALPIPSIPRKKSSLIQLEVTFWNDTATIFQLMRNNTTYIPNEWFHSTLPVEEVEYQRQRHQAERGWNTWLSGDMLSHVLLPHGLTLSLQFHVRNDTSFNSDTIRRVEHVAAPSCNLETFPLKHGLHDRRGEYTEIEELYVKSNKTTSTTTTFRIESATTPLGGLVILVTVLESGDVDNGGSKANNHDNENLQDDSVPNVVMLRVLLGVPDDYLPRYCEDAVVQEDASLLAKCPGLEAIKVSGSAETVASLVEIDSDGGPAVLQFRLPTERDKKVVLQAHPVSTDPLPREDAISIVENARAKLLRRIADAEGHNETLAGLLSAVAWNVIYTPYEGIITPVFRGSPWWLSKPHDYVLFEWDTYFSSIMASFIGDVWVATNNIVRMTQTLHYQGFVTGFWNGECGELDKSKPPVGTLALDFLIRHFPDQSWVVDLLLDHFLAWNEWWTRLRMPVPGLVAPGSNRFNVNLSIFCDMNAPPLHAAACETGLDNSPIYDKAHFLDEDNIMDHVDVGMTALFVRDCDALVNLATHIGRTDVIGPVQQRSRLAKDSIEQHLWNVEEGIYLNKNWKTGDWIPRDVQSSSYPIAPTSFYPWLYGSSSVNQVDRMIVRYLTNSSEFGVNSEIKFGIPSIARSSSAYPQQDYWRGRIWGPMNFLVYLGLLEYSNSSSSELVRQARKDLAAQSEQTFMVEWLPHHRIMENFDSSTGEGCNVGSANPFYHWGALNALIPLMEAGLVEPKSQSIPASITVES